MNRTQLQEKLLPLEHHKETKYLKWYLNIIEDANSQNRNKLNKLNEYYIYYENHHILPRSLFEEYIDVTEHPWNSVLLTAKEHFIIHLCLWKHYKSLEYIRGEIRMSYAIRSMNSMGEYNSKHYEHFKLNLTVSEEHINKMLNSMNRVDTITGKTICQLGEEKRIKTISKSSFDASYEFGIKSNITRAPYMKEIAKKISATKLADPLKLKEQAKKGVQTRNSVILDNGKSIAENMVIKQKLTWGQKTQKEKTEIYKKIKKAKAKDYIIEIFDDKDILIEQIHLYDFKNKYPNKLLTTFIGGILWVNIHPQLLGRLKNRGFDKYVGWYCKKLYTHRGRKPNVPSS